MGGVSLDDHDPYGNGAQVLVPIGAHLVDQGVVNAW